MTITETPSPAYFLESNNTVNDISFQLELEEKTKYNRFRATIANGNIPDKKNTIHWYQQFQLETSGTNL